MMTDGCEMGRQEWDSGCTRWVSDSFRNFGGVFDSIGAFPLACLYLFFLNTSWLAWHLWDQLNIWHQPRISDRRSKLEDQSHPISIYTAKIDLFCGGGGLLACRGVCSTRAQSIQRHPKEVLTHLLVGSQKRESKPLAATFSFQANFAVVFLSFPSAKPLGREQRWRASLYGEATHSPPAAEELGEVPRASPADAAWWEDGAG